MTELLASLAFWLLVGVTGALCTSGVVAAGLVARRDLRGLGGSSGESPGKVPLLGAGDVAGSLADGIPVVRAAANLAERRRSDPCLRRQAEGLARACEGHRMATEVALPLLDEAFEPGSLSWERFHAPLASAAARLASEISSSYDLLSGVDPNRLAWLTRRRDEGTLGRDPSLASELDGIMGDLGEIDRMMGDAESLSSSIAALADGLRAMVPAGGEGASDAEGPLLSEEIGDLASRLSEY